MRTADGTGSGWAGQSSYDWSRIDGRTLGLKAHEFRKFVSLPRVVRETEPRSAFEIALDIHPAAFHRIEIDGEKRRDAGAQQG